MPLPPRRKDRDIPEYWFRFAERQLCIDRRLATEAFRRLYPTPQLLLYLTQLTEREGACSLATFHHLVGQLLTPQLLLATTARLSPPGQPRRPDILRLEETILSKMTASGDWA
jgi:hypothetical protein